MNLLKLERMNGKERIAEALRMRGIFVTIDGEFILLTKENTSDDIKGVRRLLASIGVPTYWPKENKFQVLVDRLSIVIMKAIINIKGREFPVGMQSYHFLWRSFAQRRYGIKVNALDLDYNVAMLVKSLNLAGITSLAGCNGHYRYEPHVQLSGVYQGAWLQIIQEKYLDNCRLNYKWNVQFGTRSGACFIAEKEQDEKWNMQLIYQDTVEMALVLQENANEIRDLKLNTFKRNREMKKCAEKMRESQQFEKLYQWMKRKIG
jgi:hypothetical protein